MGQTR